MIKRFSMSNITTSIAGDDIRQKLEFHHTHLELGALGYIETFLFYWSWGFFQKKNPPRPIFVFENTRDLKNIFFKNRLKSFFYQSHWIAFGLTIPKWYNTWVLEIFLVNIFSKIFFPIQRGDPCVLKNENRPWWVFFLKKTP